MIKESADKQRNRWQRNKRATRERAQNASVGRVKLSPEMQMAIFAERDRRTMVDLEASHLFRRSTFFQDSLWEKAIAFAADVWAAQVIIELELGSGKATPTRIARWLKENNRSHGYTLGSLRVKVYQARQRIEKLETTLRIRDYQEPYWPPFRVALP